MYVPDSAPQLLICHHSGFWFFFFSEWIESNFSMMPLAPKPFCADFFKNKDTLIHTQTSTLMQCRHPNCRLYSSSASRPGHLCCRCFSWSTTSLAVLQPFLAFRDLGTFEGQSHWELFHLAFRPGYVFQERTPRLGCPLLSVSWGTLDGGLSHYWRHDLYHPVHRKLPGFSAVKLLFAPS